MFRKLKMFVTMALAVVAVGVAAPTTANAYLHVANAQAEGCGYFGGTTSQYGTGFWFDGWGDANYGAGDLDVVTHGSWYYRAGDNLVWIDCAMKGVYGGVWRRGEARVAIAGPDGSEAMAFVGTSPEWKYLGTDYTVAGCPNWGTAWCITGDFQPYF